MARLDALRAASPALDAFLSLSDTAFHLVSAPNPFAGAGLHRPSPGIPAPVGRPRAPRPRRGPTDR
jgi:hypothetical protein